MTREVELSKDPSRTLRLFDPPRPSTAVSSISVESVQSWLWILVRKMAPQHAHECFNERDGYAGVLEVSTHRWDGAAWALVSGVR